jgi:hypothetical protein
MNMQTGDTKKIFLGSVILAIAGGILSLLYYANLMPLHVDEAGFWFHYTNKSYHYRFIFNQLNPNHTLTIYLAKISLWMFGNTGIGLRFPVIVFGGLSAGVLYIFVRKVTGSGVIAILASALLLLNPFFLHYSHELRGYPAYFFFIICCYLCFIRLLEKGNRLSTWVMLLVLFMACYVANLAAPIFFSVFLATIWTFVILRRFPPLSDRIPGFDNIKIGAFFAYSAIAASFFAFIMFNVEREIIPNLFAVQVAEPNYLAIPDLFSTFLGYHYLDDSRSLLYSYPTIIWLISLSSCLFGWWSLMKNRNWLAPVFLLMFILNSLFYALMQTWIPLRSSIYLLPFMLLFQAYGLKALIDLIISRFFSQQNREAYAYLTLGGILFCYFSFFSIGKYRNFEPDSGNPFELARTYLQENTGPNDLIISTLYDTVGGFYLGDIFREKNHNIFESGKIENIYYISPKTGESKAELDMEFPKRAKVKIFPLKKFEPVVSFVNNGVRPSAVHIFKQKVDLKLIIDWNKQILAKPIYFGSYGKVCETLIDEHGIRLKCDQSSDMACAKERLNIPGVAINDMQIVLFNHANDKGTRTASFASVKSLDPSPMTEKKRIVPFPDVYIINKIINNIDDLDVYKEKVELVDVSVQKIGDGRNTIFCMEGRLFNVNSLIKGVKVFNLKN